MYQNTKITLIILFALIVLFTTLYFEGRSFIDTFSPDTQIISSKDANNVAQKEAPYFNLLSTSTNKINLKDLEGSALVLTFWSTWNTDSIDQIKIFDDYISKNSSIDKLLPVHIISINSQESFTIVKNFINRGRYDIKTLIDSTGEVSSNYGVQTLPTTFFIDARGYIVETYVGVLNDQMIVDKIEKILPN